MPDLVSEGHASHMLCVIVQQNHCILIDGLGSSRLLPCMAHVIIAEKHFYFFFLMAQVGKCKLTHTMASAP